MTQCNRHDEYSDPECDACNAVRTESMNEARLDYFPKAPQKIETLEALDWIKGNWAVWSCEVTMPDGSVRMGTVEADSYGMLIARETLELDEL